MATRSKGFSLLNEYQRCQLADLDSSEHLVIDSGSVGAIMNHWLSSKHISADGLMLYDLRNISFSGKWEKGSIDSLLQSRRLEVLRRFHEPLRHFLTLVVALYACGL